MWVKTLLGLVVSLILNMNLFLNVAYLFPMPRDVYLLIGFVGGFLLWGCLFTWFYSHSSIKKPLKFYIPLTIGSGMINSMFFMGVLS